MSAFAVPAGDPPAINGAAWFLQRLAGGLESDHRLLHDQVGSHSAGWAGAAGDTASAYLLSLRAAVAKRPAELAAVAATLREYAEALRTAQDAVRGLAETHATVREDAAFQLGQVEANVAPDEVDATSARILTDRDAELAGLGTAYAQVLADLDLAALTAVQGLGAVARDAAVAAREVLPDGLLVPLDPVAAGQLLLMLVGRELTPYTARVWEQLAAQLAQRLDDPAYLAAFFAAAGPAVLAVPALFARSSQGDAVLAALGDGLLALQAHGGTDALPPAVRAALDDRELSLTWSTGPLPGTAGTPAATTVLFANVEGAEGFLSFLTLVSAASGSHADPEFVALLSTQTMQLARDPVFAEIAAKNSPTPLHSRGATVPTNDMLELTARVPGAAGTLISDPEGLQELLHYGQDPDGGEAVGTVFVALTEPVALDINRAGQAALVHELAINGDAHAGLSEGARDGLVTMTIRLFPDLAEPFADPGVTRAEGADLRVSHADLAGHMRFLTTDAQDTQDLMVATGVWTQLRLAEVFEPGPGYELPVEVPLITTDGGWLTGVIIDARTDVLAEGEADRQAAELDVLVEQMLADTLVQDVGQLIGTAGDALQFSPTTRFAGTAALLVSDTIGIVASTPRPDTDGLRQQVDSGEVEDQLTSNAITSHQQLVAAAALESGRFGLPGGFEDPYVDLSTLSAAETDALRRWLAEAGLLDDGTLSAALTQGLGAG